VVAEEKIGAVNLKTIVIGIAVIMILIITIIKGRRNES